MFYGRIVRKEGGAFQSLLSEMTSYYANKKPAAKKVQEGGLYAVQEDDIVHRCDMKLRGFITFIC